MAIVPNTNNGAALGVGRAEQARLFGAFLLNGVRVGQRELGRRTGLPFARVGRIVTGRSEPMLSEVCLIDSALGANGALVVSWVDAALRGTGLFSGRSITNASKALTVLL